MIFTNYRKVMSSNTSHLEAHEGFFQIAYEGDFRSLCTVTFWRKVDLMHVRTRDYTVIFSDWQGCDEEMGNQFNLWRLQVDCQLQFQQSNQFLQIFVQYSPFVRSSNWYHITHFISICDVHRTFFHGQSFKFNVARTSCNNGKKVRQS